MTKRLLASILCALAPAGALAIDSPHDASFTTGSCKGCHLVHGAPGASLTSVAGNPNLCASCHSQAGVGARLGFPWVSKDQAIADVYGHSHHWSAGVASAAHGAQAPLSTEMAKRTDGGNLQCSTCHDQHAARAASGGVQHTSVAPDVAIARTAGSGSGACDLDPPAAAAAAKGYLLEIVAGGAAGTATFRISHDNGTSWFGWNGTAWEAANANGKPTGLDVALDDGTNVQVDFVGGSGTSFVAGDRWKFYISYPFLRISNVASAMCEDCHRERVQSSLRVEGGDAGYVPDGTKLFSHPVGEALAKTYDRTAGILDANGVLQSTGDGIRTNDVSFDAAGKVRCMSCHYPHNADSNSLTEDAR